MADNSDDIPFDTPANYTYDAAKGEITGSAWQHKDQTPANSTFHANYSADEDGNWGDGALTGTLVNATVAAGKLDCKGGGTKYCDYDADLNADHQQAGCVRISVKPNYSGSPPSSYFIFAICKANVDPTNAIALYHDSAGNIALSVKDGNNLYIINNVSLGAWNPTSGVEYEFELNWDLTGGATRLFIDGVQHGSTLANTGTRGSDIGLLRIGVNCGASADNDMEFDDLIVFSTVQHTANYTPGASIPATRYVTTAEEVEMNYDIQPARVIQWLLITVTGTFPGGSSINFQYSINAGVAYNGSWVAEAACEALIQAIIPVRDGTDTMRFKFQLACNGTDRIVLGNVNLTSTYDYTPSGTSPINPLQVCFEMLIAGRDLIKLPDQPVAYSNGAVITISGAPGYAVDSLIGVPLRIKGVASKVWRICSNTADTVTINGSSFILTSSDYVHIGASFNIHVLPRHAIAKGKWKVPYLILYQGGQSWDEPEDVFEKFSQYSYGLRWYAMGRTEQEAIAIREVVSWIGKKYRAGYGQYHSVKTEKTYPEFKRLTPGEVAWPINGIIHMYKFGEQRVDAA